MQIIPRDYQEAAHDAVYHYFAKNATGNPLVALPTGTGKAVVIAMLIERALKWFPGQRIMALTHVKELIDQNYKKLKTMWPHAPAGIYSSGLGKREHHFPVTFAGIGSVHKRTQQFGHHDLILIDEAHLVSDSDSAMYVAFLTNMKKINPNLKIIGFTATKYRVGMGLLTNGKIFNDICFDLTDFEGFNWLLNQGYMKPLVPRPTELEFDLSAVHTQQGDFNQAELQEAVDRADLNKQMLTEICDTATKRKHWLIFGSGVEHALHLADILEQMGIPSVAIHSKMAPEDRDKAIEGFKLGYYRCAVNNNILTTGFDFPEIDMIGVGRPSKSASLWVQMLGRGTRPVYAPGANVTTREGRLEAIYYGGAPDCLVMDFARNTLRLGPINDPVIPKQKGKGGGGGEAPVKQCPACGTYIHASVTVCPYCHADIPRQLKIDTKAGQHELIKKSIEGAKPIEPTVETFQVERVTYQPHHKPGRPTSLRATYYTSNGFRRFEEWVCLEHDGFPKRKAVDWWKRRAGYDKPAPETVADAMARLGDLKEPRAIRVRTDLKLPEIVGHEDLVRPEPQTFP